MMSGCFPDIAVTFIGEGCRCSISKTISVALALCKAGIHWLYNHTKLI